MFEELTTIDWVLLGVLFALFVFQVYWYSRYLAAPVRKMRKALKSPQDNQPSDANLPGVSIVLSAHNESYNLSTYLQALLTQDYPTYEVIVVDDGSQDSTRDVIDSYMVQDSRLQTTFVPFGARVRSTKKLALTLAAKAAKYDYLLLTDADCVPESNQWIRKMMAGFQEPSIDIVLGFGPYFFQRGLINRIVRYDTLFNGLHYLGAALCGHPYMGVGRNLAYRKQFFFESGGFTHLMDSKAGDDDLFVNHTATKQNTAVVLDRAAYTWSPAKTTLRDWLQQKRRHLSVSPAYRQNTKLRLAVEPITRGLFYAMTIALIYCGLQSPITSWRAILMLGITLLFFLARWCLQTSILNDSAHLMGLHRFRMSTTFWFDLILPLITLWMLIIPRRKTNKW